LISIIIGFTIIAFIVFLSYKQTQIKPILMTISLCFLLYVFDFIYFQGVTNENKL
jgi:hypothetical protein